VAPPSTSATPPVTAAGTDQAVMNLNREGQAMADLTIITKNGAVTARGVNAKAAKREIDARIADGRDVVITTSNGNRRISPKDITHVVITD
jgi:DUF4097 and DUF4098 domain-containing protein YvlB